MFLFDKLPAGNNEFFNSNIEIILSKKKILSKKNTEIVKINKNINIIFLTPYIGYIDNCYSYAVGQQLANVPVYIDSNKVILFYNKIKGLYDYREGLFLNCFSPEWDLKVFLDLNLEEGLKIFIKEELFIKRFELIKKFKRDRKSTYYICNYNNTKVSFEISDDYENYDREIFLTYNGFFDFMGGEKVYNLEFIE